MTPQELSRRGYVRVELACGHVQHVVAVGHTAAGDPVARCSPCGGFSSHVVTTTTAQEG